MECLLGREWSLSSVSTTEKSVRQFTGDQVAFAGRQLFRCGICVGNFDVYSDYCSKKLLIITVPIKDEIFLLGRAFLRRCYMTALVTAQNDCVLSDIGGLYNFHLCRSLIFSFG